MEAPHERLSTPPSEEFLEAMQEAPFDDRHVSREEKEIREIGGFVIASALFPLENHSYCSTRDWYAVLYDFLALETDRKAWLP